MIPIVVQGGAALLLAAWLTFGGVATIKHNEVEFIQHEKSNWISGEYRDYEFKGKVFPNPSVYGINNGNISKLIITHNDKTILIYEREWIEEPPKEDRKAVDKIISEIEDWANNDMEVREN